MSAASGASAVSVLAPNGRRVTVRVGPSTTLLQVLEDVCKKQNFSPSEYDLKFQRTVLDLSLQWRFANLPNNAKLEMVPVSHNRVGNETTVRIALQLDNGSRLQDTFCSSQTLWEILGHFAQTREYVEQHCEISPVCIYMRDEVTGKSALEKTTLKSLGLTGGNAIIRVAMKVPAATGHTEAGSSTSPSKEQTAKPASWEELAGTSLPRTNALPATSAQSVEAICANRCSDKQGWSEESPDSSVEHHPPSEPVPSSFVPFVGSGQRLGSGSSNVAVAMRSPISDVPLSSMPISSPGGPSKAKKSKNSQEKQKEQKEYLEREPIVCHPDLQEPLDLGLQDLPDEFFEVTVDDVRKRLAQLQNERKRLEEAPLMTQAQRDARMKEKLDRYSKANLFPAAVIHFGSEKHNDHYLRPDLLESAVSPSEADLLVARFLSKSATHAPQPSSELVLDSPPEPNEVDENVVVGHSETAAAFDVPQSQARRTPSGKVPKWLKLPDTPL